jgi:hypothetical protein
MRARCVLSTCTPHRTAAQETPARTGRYWPCTTPADKMPALQIRNSPNAGPRSITSRVEHPTTHRRTGDACTYRPVLALHPRPPIKMPAPRFRYSPSARPRSITTRVEHPTTHRRTGDVCTYTPVLALHPRPPIKCPHYKSDTARMLDRGRSRREWSTHNAPPHRRRLHVHAGTGHPPINCLHHDSDTARMLVRDHVAMRA